MRTIERNYSKKPHTARFLMAFHAGSQGLPSDIADDTEALATEAAQDDLLDMVPETTVADLRSPAQASLMGSLIEQITALDAEAGRKAQAFQDGITERGTWTPGRNGNASEWISRMIAKVKELKVAKPVTPTAAPVKLEDGIYLLDGEVIKVVHAIHGSGRQYGKKLVAPEVEGENGAWVMVSGVVSKLTPAMKMTLADAEKYGALYGCCVRCGRGLTKESSIAQAMGDKCASKF